MRSMPGLRLIVAVLMGMLVGACGSSDAGSSAVTADRTDPNLAPVKVGMIAPIGTPEGDFPSLRSALAAGITALNGRGGLNGHRVEMVFCNDKSDPNEAAGCARRMVDEKVVAITGGVSLFDVNIQPILAKAGIPIVGINPIGAELFNAKNVYLPQAPTFVSQQAALGYAVKNDLLPVAVAFSDNPAGRAFAGRLEGTLKKMTGGVGFAASAPIANDTADYAPIAATLEAAKPKSLLMIASSQLQQGLMQALQGRGSGIAAYFSQPSLSLKEIRDRGSLASQLITGPSFPSYNDATMKRFREELKAQAATGDKDASLDTLVPYAVNGWVALQAVEQVTTGLEAITAPTVTKALDNAKDIDLGGVFARWTPSKAGPEGLRRVSNTSVWLVGFENGEQLSLTGAPVGLEDIVEGDFEARVPAAVARANK